MCIRDRYNVIKKTSSLQQVLFRKPVKPWLSLKIDFPPSGAESPPTFTKLPTAVEPEVYENTDTWRITACQYNPLLLSTPVPPDGVTALRTSTHTGTQFSLLHGGARPGHGEGSWHRMLTQPPAQTVLLFFRYMNSYWGRVFLGKKWVMARRGVTMGLVVDELAREAAKYRNGIKAIKVEATSLFLSITGGATAEEG